MNNHILNAASCIALAAFLFGTAPLHAAAAVDSVSGPPLYPAAGTPDNTLSYPMCNSNAKTNQYSLLSGTDAAAVAWFASHLTNFTHSHGMRTGARQDYFIKNDGTAAAMLTANNDGIHLFGISYVRFTPPLNSAWQKKLAVFMTTGSC